MTASLAPERYLGSTGIKVPLIGYGTAPLGKPDVTREHAVRCLNLAIDRGITYLDTSPDYGSEPHIGEVMKSRRSEVFLATKVNRRSKDGVLDEIRQSLERLQTDHVDLIQIHAISAQADVEQALAPDGAAAALEEARDQGMVRFLGITGHARPDLLAQMLSRYPFDTVLVALGMADRLVTGPELSLLPLAREKKTGVIAMKCLGHGQFKGREAALRYSLGLDGVSLAIVGLKEEREIEEILEHAVRFRPLEEQEEIRLIEEVRPLIERDSQEWKKGNSPLFWLHETSVMGWQEKDEPALANY
jgi:aryl-alcohol dehydrogenase-like predicted oxidoreductase